MQQVFAMVNSLLVKNEATRQRDLHVRGYKVQCPTNTCWILGRAAEKESSVGSAIICCGRTPPLLLGAKHPTAMPARIDPPPLGMVKRNHCV